MNLWIVTLTFVCLVFLAAHAFFREQNRRQQKARKQASINQVKYRRKLVTRLRRIVGDDMLANHLAQEEARRMNLPSSSIEVLTAAIDRARLERDNVPSDKG